MNSGAPLSFLNKLANVETCTYRPEDFVSGFVEYLVKEAGMNEYEAFGVVCFFADQEMESKQAGVTDFFKDKLKSTIGPDNYNHVRNVWNNPTAAAKGAVIGAAHPGLINTAEKINKGDWGSVVKDVGGKAVDWLSNSDNLKSVARYAAPGIATYLGSKAIGMGTGDSMLAGAAGAVGGNYLYNNWDDIKKKFEPSPSVLPPVAQAPVQAQEQAAVNPQQQVQEGAQKTLDRALKQ